MQTNNYAIIDNTVIVNCAVATEEYAQSQGWILLENGFGIGDFYIDGNFIKAPQPQPTPEEIQAQNKQQAEKLLQETDWTEYQSVTDTTKNPHLLNVNEFIDYRVTVRSIAVNPPTTLVTFPNIPKEIWSS